jgi:hypothetical protein
VGLVADAVWVTGCVEEGVRAECTQREISCPMFHLLFKNRLMERISVKEEKS